MNVGGIVVGISMLDQILSEVKVLDLKGRKEIGDELLKDGEDFQRCSKTC